ncbi:hypothetical protein NUSPORA_02650 [Nucleospora cyclopteri]
MKFNLAEEINITVNDSYKEKITSISSQNGLYIGREDGFMDAFCKNDKYTVECFTKEYDLLENEHIKEGITAIEKYETHNIDDRMFVSNERAIKIMQIKPIRSVREILNENYSDDEKFAVGAKIFNSAGKPRVFQHLFSVEKKLPNAHKYLINSLSLSMGQEFLISSDLLKTNLWKPDRMDVYYNLIDIKPEISQGNIYVLTTAEFSKYRDAVFGFATSTGNILLQDARINTRSSNFAVLENYKRGSSIKSISDFKFIDENRIASRNLNTITIYDIRNPTRKVFDQILFKETSTVVGSDLMYEKFKLAAYDDFIITGSTNSSIYFINTLNEKIEEIKIENHTEKQNSLVKFVSVNKDGFYCCVNKTIYRYSENNEQTK